MKIFLFHETQHGTWLQKPEFEIFQTTKEYFSQKECYIIWSVSRSVFSFFPDFKWKFLGDHRISSEYTLKGRVRHSPRDNNV